MVKADVAFLQSSAQRSVMRTVLCFCLSALALGGCGQRTPASSDADYQAFKESHPGMTAQCLEAVRYGGVSAWRPDDPDLL